MQAKETVVYCTTQFEGFHQYDGAPSNVSFLRHRHRHIFHVKVTCRVTHANRDIEFISLKSNVDSIIHGLRANWSRSSCEMIAHDIAEEIRSQSTISVASVEVSEDGENGAITYYE